jgi:hypothetical protein
MMSDRDLLAHAREQYSHARQELAEREWALTNQLVVEAKKNLDCAREALELAHALVREIPGQASLDFNGARLDTIKGLEATQRELKALRDKLGQMGAWEP